MTIVVGAHSPWPPAVRRALRHQQVRKLDGIPLSDISIDQDEVPGLHALKAIAELLLKRPAH